jgi:hypothetical protein
MTNKDVNNNRQKSFVTIKVCALKDCSDNVTFPNVKEDRSGSNVLEEPKKCGS